VEERESEDYYFIEGRWVVWTEKSVKRLLEGDGNSVQVI